MNRAVIIDYTNHRGERRERRVEPNAIMFEATKWHPVEQWILWAYDCEKSDNPLNWPSKGFALSSIHSWRPAGD